MRLVRTLDGRTWECREGWRSDHSSALAARVARPIMDHVHLDCRCGDERATPTVGLDWVELPEDELAEHIEEYVRPGLPPEVVTTEGRLR